MDNETAWKFKGFQILMLLDFGFESPLAGAEGQRARVRRQAISSLSVLAAGSKESRSSGSE
jgi:hypothetical protein